MGGVQCCWMAAAHHTALRAVGGAGVDLVAAGDAVRHGVRFGGMDQAANG